MKSIKRKFSLEKFTFFQKNLDTHILPGLAIYAWIPAVLIGFPAIIFIICRRMRWYPTEIHHFWIISTIVLIYGTLVSQVIIISYSWALRTYSNDKHEEYLDILISDFMSRLDIVKFFESEMISIHKIALLLRALF